MLHSLSRLVRSLSHRNFHTAKAYHSLQLHLSAPRGKDRLLVYQMGKVGSSTVVRSLHSLALDIPIHHVHMLTNEGINRFEAFAKENFSAEPLRVMRHLTLVKYLRKELDRQKSKHRWKVISLVRDPVTRNISSFFEILDLQMNYGLKEKLRQKGIDHVVEELFDFFLEEYPDHDLPLTFFDTELKNVFGVDVYSRPFPKSQGYTIYKGENVEFLLMRLESLNRCAQNAFEEFLGVKGFKLIKANIGNEKNYAEVYSRFMSSIRLPQSYLKKMYESKYSTHFYTSEEIETFKAKWGMKTSN